MSYPRNNLFSRNSLLYKLSRVLNNNIKYTAPSLEGAEGEKDLR